MIIKRLLAIYLILWSQCAFSTEITKKFQWRSSGFTENKGQFVDEKSKTITDLKYVFDYNGLKILLKSSGFSYEVYYQEQAAPISEAGTTKSDALKQSIPFKIERHRVDICFIDANPNPEITHEKLLPGYYNYYNISAPVLNVHSYQRILYKDIYPHIDMAFYIKGNQPEYDFILNPGANIKDIQLMYDGMNSINIDMNGAINLHTKLGYITESITKSYQKEDHKQITVHYQYNSTTIGFHTDKYDKSKTLIIDPVPVMFWGRYFGGPADDNSNYISLDSKNNIVLTGTTGTLTTNFATSGAHQASIQGQSDAYIARFNSNGTLLWATYYGGSKSENSYNITIDPKDNIIICGSTGSSTGIATPGTYDTVYDNDSTDFDDAFVSKFDSSGTLLWGTYYGGESEDRAYAVNLDLNGNIVLVGYTESNYYMTSPGSFQTQETIPKYPLGQFSLGFIAKFDSNGTAREWGTYYGGGNSYTYFGAFCTSVAVDSKNTIVVYGYTDSTNTISSSGAYQLNYGGGEGDAFLAAFNTDGNRIWGTYYGGSGTEYYSLGFAGDLFNSSTVKIDSNDDIIITGFTNSTNAIASPGAFQSDFAGYTDAFVTKFNNQGNRLWGTYYGGKSIDYSSNLAIGQNNNIYIIGYTGSSSNISTICSHQYNFSGYEDAFIAAFNSSGNRIWGTYENNENGSVGYGIAIDNANNIIVSGVAFEGSVSSNMITTPFNGTVNNNSFFLSSYKERTPSLPEISGPSLFCQGKNIILTSSIGTAYQWSNGLSTQSITVTQPGSYKVNVSSDTFNCVLTSALFQVQYIQPVILPSDSGKFCNGDTATLVSSKGISYLWSNGDTTQSISVSTQGIYSVTVKDTSGCIASNKINITKVTPPSVFIGNDTTLCIGTNKTIQLNFPAANYLWMDGSAQSSYTISKPGTYSVLVTEYPCTPVLSNSINIQYISKIDYTVANLITYNDDRLNDAFLIGNIIPNTHVEIYNRWGDLVFRSDNYQNNWYPDQVSDGIYFYNVSNSNTCVGDYKGWVQIVK
jgi:hypothetical protein